MIGPEGDVTERGHEGHAARLELIQPFLKPEELQAFKHMDYRGWRAKVSTFCVAGCSALWICCSGKVCMAGAPCSAIFVLQSFGAL